MSFLESLQQETTLAIEGGGSTSGSSGNAQGGASAGEERRASRRPRTASSTSNPLGGGGLGNDFDFNSLSNTHAASTNMKTSKESLNVRGSFGGGVEGVRSVLDSTTPPPNTANAIKSSSKESLAQSMSRGGGGGGGGFKSVLDSLHDPNVGHPVDQHHNPNSRSRENAGFLGGGAVTFNTASSSDNGGYLNISSSNNQRRASGGITNSFPQQSNKDEFSNFDLGDMLGLNEKEKPQKTALRNNPNERISLVSAPSTSGSSKSFLDEALTSNSISNEAAQRRRRPASIKSNHSVEEELPSFLQNTGLTEPGRRVGRGSLLTSTTATTPIDYFSGISKESTSAIKSSYTATTPSTVNPSSQSQQSTSAENQYRSPLRAALEADGPKISIFDILEKKDPVSAASDVKSSNAKAPSLKIKKKDLDSESLSSVELMSDTDDEELAVPKNHNIAETKKPNGSKSSLVLKKTIADLEAESNQLKQDLETAKKEVERFKWEMENTKKEVEKAQEQSKLEKEKLESSLKLEHLQNLEKLKNAHSEAISKANETVQTQKSEMESIKAANDLRTSELQANHLNELKNMISTAEGAQKLNALVGKVTNTTDMVEKLQTQLNETNDENLRVREGAVSVKEVHLQRIEDQLHLESKQIQKERLAIEQLLLEMQEKEKLTTLKYEQTVEQNEREGERLKREISQYEKMRDSLNFVLKQDQDVFYAEVKVWNGEKQRLLENLNNERKELAMMRATLASQKQQFEIDQQQWTQQHHVKDQEITMAKSALTRDQLEVKHRLDSLYKDEALLKTERFKLQEKLREVETATAIYHQEERGLERKFAQLSSLRDEAYNEKERATKQFEENEQSAKYLERQKSEALADLERISNSKRRLIDERVARSVQYQRQGLPGRYILPAGQPNQRLNAYLPQQVNLQQQQNQFGQRIPMGGGGGIYYGSASSQPQQQPSVHYATSVTPTQQQMMMMMNAQNQNQNLNPHQQQQPQHQYSLNSMMNGGGGVGGGIVGQYPSSYMSNGGDNNSRQGGGGGTTPHHSARWTSSERDLAASLELQLESYLAKMKEGYSENNIKRQMESLLKIQH